MQSRSLKLYGTERPEPEERMLRAGPLEAGLRDGNLRRIRFGGIEIIRAVAYVVRDRDWGTLKPTIRNLEVEETPERFRVSYEAHCDSAGSVLHYSATIAGSSAGELSFVVDATPTADFETNRCGFNVLHPITGVSGSPVRVEHCDGSREEAVFPDLIEPWQPFKSIRALTHWPEHLEVECRLLGDEFEMEDQRNWSDASYKTYVRPLELPWPYVLPTGKTNRQSVMLSVRPTAEGGVRMASDGPVHVEPGPALDRVMPRIGLVIAPDEIEATLRHIDLLESVGPQAILCHYDPTAGHGGAAIAGFARLQAAFPADYELECVVAGEGDLDEELTGVARHVREAGLKLASIAVCPSVDRQSTPPGSTWPACPPLDDVCRAARNAFPGLTLGGGMFSYFTELNRKRPPLDRLDYVMHATNPIVHAADDESVMETLETLPHITRSARAIIGARRGYRLGPTTIGMRQNPYGSRTMDNPDGARICMAHDDPRQRGRFAAAWIAGYAAAIADAGIERWIPAAFVGPRGIVGEGGLLPVGRVVAALAGWAGRQVVSCKTSDPRRLACLGLSGTAGTEILMANLSSEPLAVVLAADFTLDGFEVVRVAGGEVRPVA